MSDLIKSRFDGAWTGSRDRARASSTGIVHGCKRPVALVLAVGAMSLLAACGGSSTPASGSSAPAGGAAVAVGSVLTGTVGEADAFTISLKDSTGAPVTSLKAGSYEVKVKDASKIHNFHLTGPGVEQTTTVPETTEVTWKITVSAGTYKYVCDPHGNMSGTFTVS